MLTVFYDFSMEISALCAVTQSEKRILLPLMKTCLFKKMEKCKYMLNLNKSNLKNIAFILKCMCLLYGVGTLLIV